MLYTADYRLRTQTIDYTIWEYILQFKKQKTIILVRSGIEDYFAACGKSLIMLVDRSHSFPRVTL